MENRRRCQRKKCVICGVRQSRNSNTFLARFPLNPDRCRLWVKASGDEDLIHLPIEKLHELKFICGSHFAQECFNANRNRLLKTAVPTERLTRPLLSDNSLTDFPLHVKSFYNKENMRPENGDTNEADCSVQPIDDNDCPDTVAVEYEITCETCTSDSENGVTEDLCVTGVPERRNVSSIEPNGIHNMLGISYISTHFNNKLLKNQPPQCPTDQIINTQTNQNAQKVNSDTIVNLTKDEQIKSLKQQCRTLTARLKRQRERIMFYKKQMRNAQNLTKEKFDALTARVPEVGKRLMWMQLHQSKKKNGSRFDTNEKLMCLAIKKYKPECFKFLQKTFLMPCGKTLKQFVAKLQLPDSKNLEKEQNNVQMDETEVITNTLDRAASDARIAYEMHKGVLGEFMQFNNGTTNLADFTDLEHGLC